MRACLGEDQGAGRWWVNDIYDSLETRLRPFKIMRDSLICSPSSIFSGRATMKHNGISTYLDECDLYVKRGTNPHRPSLQTYPQPLDVDEPVQPAPRLVWSETETACFLLSHHLLLDGHQDTGARCSRLLP